MSFAEQLRRWRERARMSQGEFADALGVKQQTVSMWEAGKARPRVERARRIAEILDVPQDELLTALGEVAGLPPSSVDVDRLVERIRGLDAEDREFVESVLALLHQRRRRT